MNEIELLILRDSLFKCVIHYSTKKLKQKASAIPSVTCLPACQAENSDPAMTLYPRPVYTASVTGHCKMYSLCYFIFLFLFS